MGGTTTAPKKKEKIKINFSGKVFSNRKL